MRLPFTAPADHGEYLESARSPLLSLPCLLAIVVAIVVVDVTLGWRLALITAGSAAASLATRLPRVVAATALGCLVVAAIAVLGDSGSASVTAAHAVVHATRHK